MIYILSTALAAAVLALDQWLKAWVSANIPLGEALPFLPGLVELRTEHNYGAAWSAFSGMRWMLIAVPSAIVLGVLYLLARRIIRHPVGVLGCCLVVAGGLGNILDRIRLGYVVDMFNFLFMNFPVFNVADVCIDAGCVLALIYYLRLYEKHDKGGSPHGNPDPASR